MKTNRILAKIAMAMLLLTLPASASDYTLGIFGNANEDDTINMQDVTYTELIILEYRDKTELADGKHDGKINMQDVTQIELIILGKEKEITLMDQADRVVTIPQPIESVAIMYASFAEVVVAIDALDKVSAVDTTTKGSSLVAPMLEDKPVVGTHGEIDYERMFEIRPQIVITYPGAIPAESEEQLKHADIQLVFLNCGRRPLSVRYGINMMGIILDKQQETGEFLDFINEYVGPVEERLGELDEDEKKRVYWESSGKTCGRGSGWHEFLVMSGAKNIYDDVELVKGTFEASDEEILVRNPQAVLAKSSWASTAGGYMCTDSSEMAALRDELISRPGWDGMDAVRDDQVYVIYGDFMQRPRSMVGVCYFAKCLYPELFQDIDVTAFHEEWLEEFYGLEYKGVYAYPSECCPGLNVV